MSENNRHHFRSSSTSTSINSSVKKFRSRSSPSKISNVKVKVNDNMSIHFNSMNLNGSNANTNVNDSSDFVTLKNSGHHHNVPKNHNETHQQQHDQDNLNLSSQSHDNSSFKTPSRLIKTPSNKSAYKSGPSSQPQLPGSAKKPMGFDRFQPDRPNLEMAHYLLQQQQPVLGQDDNKENSHYSRSLTETMLGVPDLASERVLNFTQKPKGLRERYQNPLNVVYQGQGPTGRNNSSKHHVIPKSSDKVLDAPDIVDDFYLNLLAWSQENIVAIALKDQVYLWSPRSEIRAISCDMYDRGMGIVTSVCWIENGVHLAVGLDTGTIQIWDIEKLKPIRILKTDEPNVGIGALAINLNNLVQGNKVGTLRNHDLREQAHETIRIKNAHMKKAAICGVKFNCDGKLLATGGNDGNVKIWDFSNISSSRGGPVQTFSHPKAGVKALCWAPSNSKILASGGGENDHTIKLWNVSNGSLVKSIDAENQVSGLVWNNSQNEIVSTHGHPKNQLAIWKYPEMTKVDDIIEHEGRILYTALSPDETTVATAGADETLRFFKIFPPTKSGSSKLNLVKKDPKQHFQFMTLR